MSNKQVYVHPIFYCYSFMMPVLLFASCIVYFNIDLTLILCFLGHDPFPKSTADLKSIIVSNLVLNCLYRIMYQGQTICLYGQIRLATQNYLVKSI